MKSLGFSVECGGGWHHRCHYALCDCVCHRSRDNWKLIAAAAFLLIAAVGGMVWVQLTSLP